MIQATYNGEVEHNNTKGLLFSLAFSGFYGVQGVGDLVNLAPYEQSENNGGVLDPTGSYNLILNEPPINVGVFAEIKTGGYQFALAPNAVPTLTNLGILIYAPGGAELNTNEAYAGALPAGASITLMVFVPLQ
jgi:hypothetical protein